ncbi:hypothetical protein JKP88DRAFT_218889 [Tribonema minus]|uniref:RanBP2-type domain-containing protein n=1 Tax=Tribonema minus TaxID=303371 RepID=A0A835Z3D1_9STRA|nr:hypothetical protein JKP88DRAFT_218889 [Tribonema minus]
MAATREHQACANSAPPQVDELALHILLIALVLLRTAHGGHPAVFTDLTRGAVAPTTRSSAPSAAAQRAHRLHMAIRQTAERAGRGLGSTGASPAGNGVADMFGPAPGQWRCDNCLVDNQISGATCVGCHALRAAASARHS